MNPTMDSRGLNAKPVPRNTERVGARSASRGSISMSETNKISTGEIDILIISPYKSCVGSSQLSENDKPTSPDHTMAKSTKSTKTRWV